MKSRQRHLAAHSGPCGRIGRCVTQVHVLHTRSHPPHSWMPPEQLARPLEGDRSCVRWYSPLLGSPFASSSVPSRNRDREKSASASRPAASAAPTCTSSTVNCLCLACRSFPATRSWARWSTSAMGSGRRPWGRPSACRGLPVPAASARIAGSDARIFATGPSSPATAATAASQATCSRTRRSACPSPCRRIRCMSRLTCAPASSAGDRCAWPATTPSTSASMVSERLPTCLRSVPYARAGMSTPSRDRGISRRKPSHAASARPGRAARKSHRRNSSTRRSSSHQWARWCRLPCERSARAAASSAAGST